MFEWNIFNILIELVLFQRNDKRIWMIMTALGVFDKILKINFFKIVKTRNVKISFFVGVYQSSQKSYKFVDVSKVMNVLFNSEKKTIFLSNKCPLV